jgi:hypothetical protein
MGKPRRPMEPRRGRRHRGAARGSAALPGVLQAPAVGLNPCNGSCQHEARRQGRDDGATSVSQVRGGVSRSRRRRS